MLVTPKTKRHRKIRISVNVPRGTRKWNANFQLKGLKVKTSTAILPRVFLWAADPARRLRRRLQTGWSNLLSTPEMLGSRMDSHISCRRSAPTSFIVMLDLILLHSTCYCVCSAVLYVRDALGIVSWLDSCWFGFLCLCPTYCGQRHNGFVLFVCASICTSRNIVNTLSCRLFDTFSLK